MNIGHTCSSVVMSTVRVTRPHSGNVTFLVEPSFLDLIFGNQEGGSCRDLHDSRIQIFVFALWREIVMIESIQRQWEQEEQWQNLR
jgi:hypothetical protein